jgi:hypothetical protein
MCQFESENASKTDQQFIHVYTQNPNVNQLSPIGIESGKIKLNSSTMEIFKSAFFSFFLRHQVSSVIIIFVLGGTIRVHCRQIAGDLKN